jgi:hypothetical protein
MPHIRLSARAQSDLSRLYTFLASKDINAAKRAMLARIKGDGTLFPALPIIPAVKRGYVF